LCLFVGMGRRGGGGGGHAISTAVRRPLLDAYLLHNTEEGLGVEKGSQSVGRSFGPTPGQQLMK